MLINMQRPGSTFVATVKDWKNKYGRSPKPGASPLIILKAFGPVSYVYELSDTEGKEFPEDLEKPFNNSGTISVYEFDNLIKALPFLGVELYQSKYGTALAGTAESKEEIKVFDYKNKQYYVPFSITVNEDHDTSSQFATICHELGHILCGHLYYSKSVIKEESYLPTRFGISKETKEFEAESVCWLVCERIGIKNPSAKYLSNYLQNNSMVPYISLEAILRATGTIERMLKGDVVKPHKALVIK
ncbi:MAG: ImmA/IrrE family metallo-endopeptidase [Oribacterium sp.]|nr:ImmA/IrrE family metallo-endopeptidase [Oribacterium sp.]